MAYGNLLGQRPDLSKYALKSDLNRYLPLTGGAMSGNIAMSSKKITGLNDGTEDKDAVNLRQLNKNNIPETLPNFFNTNINGTLKSGSYLYGTYTAYVRQNTTVIKIVAKERIPEGTYLSNLYSSCIAPNNAVDLLLLYPLFEQNGGLFYDKGLSVENMFGVGAEPFQGKIKTETAIEKGKTVYAILPFCYAR